MKIIATAFLVGLSAAACGPMTPTGPSPQAAIDAPPLTQAAAAAVQARFPGELWTDVREKQGLREGVVCASVAGEQVIYRERRELLMSRSDFGAEEWTSLWENWCIDTPYR